MSKAAFSTTIFAAVVLPFGLAAPTHADSWTDWHPFAEHNQVVLEWRTYSYPDHDTKADWRVANNSDEELFRLNLGTRFYECSNGSAAFKMLSLLGGVSLKPGASVTLSEGGAADYVRADGFDRNSCPSIVGASFESKADMLEYASRVRPDLGHLERAARNRKFQK